MINQQPYKEKNVVIYRVILMKYIGIFPLLCASLCAHAEGIPLEWNANRVTDVPYEVRIDRSKISRIAGLDAEHSYKIVAQTSAGKQQLAVQHIKSNDKNNVLLRFTVPTGTTALSCVPVADKSEFISPDDCDNIFAGVLTPGRWYPADKKKTAGISAHKEGLLIEAPTAGDYIVNCSVKVPEKLAGRPVRLDMTLQSLSKMTWRNPMTIKQYDDKNKLLDLGVTDPRWISHLRPPQTETRYVESGVIHPRAAKLVFSVTLSSRISKNDNHGMPLADKTATNPKLLIKSLALREAHVLPFPKYRDAYFKPGVSNRPGDTSLDLGGRGCFYFATTGQEVWAEGRQLKNVLDSFYPFGDGTVECYINANKWHNKENILLQAANTINSVNGLYLKNRGPLFELSYSKSGRKLTVYLKDAKDKVFKKSIGCVLEPGKWYHLCVQWTRHSGVRVFVDGRTVLQDASFHYQATDVKKERYPNALNAHQFTVGTHVSAARGAAVHREKYPEFDGKIDLLRISSRGRYNRDFVPEKSFTVDRSTRALFDFDRSFNGKSFGSSGIIEGTTRDVEGRQDRKISFNGRMVQYIPEKVADDSHQDKVLNRLNYPVVPQKDDFISSRRKESIVLKLAPGEKTAATLDSDVKMESIEFTNLNREPVNHPAIVRKGEVDPRSFGDIADTLDLANTPHRERAYKIFNFLLGASDYFINYQVEFFPESKKPFQATNLALVMLNSYCGFECGPLNNLAAILFACSGHLPSSQTAGYAHSFEQVFYDGRNRLYDLSAQKFFPSFDNESAASLNDAELQSGVFCRVAGRADHFVRLTTRKPVVNQIDFMEKVGVTVKQGETLKVFFANNGMFNELNMSGVFRRKVTCDVEDFSKRFDCKTQYPIRRVPRPFPHYGSSLLLFDAAPAKYPAAFGNSGAESFTYGVNSSYPVVGGCYRAELGNGKYADIELSVDGGKSFVPLKKDADGTFRLKYEIMGHHKIVFKIKSPMANVKRFTAGSVMMTNPRVLTGKLVKGRNELEFKSTSGGKCDIRIIYSKKDAPIEISGGVYTGAVPGYERQLFAGEPGSELTLDVKGVSEKAVASATGGLSAVVKNSKLTVKIPHGKTSSFEEVSICDGKRTKRLTFIVSPGVKLVPADAAILSGKAKLKTAGKDLVQNCVLFSKTGDRAVFKTSIPAGRYQVWNVNRMPSHISQTHSTHKKRILHMNIDGKDLGAGDTGNTVCNFYKAQFGKPGGRSNFKWDFPMTPQTTYPYHRPYTLDLGDVNEFSVYMKKECSGGAELAAVLFVPCDDPEFVTEMIKVLAGLNYDRWSIEKSVKCSGGKSK